MLKTVNRSQRPEKRQVGFYPVRIRASQNISNRKNCTLSGLILQGGVMWNNNNGQHGLRVSYVPNVRYPDSYHIYVDSTGVCVRALHLLYIHSVTLQPLFLYLYFIYSIICY
jgi:hypothetical protein